MLSDLIADDSARMVLRVEQGKGRKDRHAMLSPMLLGIDIRVIQVLLGHAKLNTTALYTRVATSTIRKVMSPLDRLSLLEKRSDPKA